MRRELVICDKCGKNNAKPVQVFIDRRMDAAGSMENLYDDVDLCHECAIKALHSFLNGRSNIVGNTVTGSEFVSRWRTAK